MLAYFSIFLFQWSVINELDKLQKLQSLDCRNNPLMDIEKNAATVKQLIIAKIGQLRFLNKSEVCRFFSISSVEGREKCFLCLRTLDTNHNMELIVLGVISFLR